MSYFFNFPKILYSTSLGVKNPVLVTNIIAKVNFLSEVVDNTSIYYRYSVKDGERAEDIANKMYGSPLKHWIILLSNNIIDPQYDWVLSVNALEDYINKKYSSITFQLDPSESYTSTYTVGEKVFQGPDYAGASCTATVVSSNNTAKTLTVNFADQVFANAINVTGSTSNVTHKVVGITYNNDGFQWASNTTSHYQVTEVFSNNSDNVKNTNKYKVSVEDYNFNTDTIYNRNTNVSYSNSYPLSDGTTLTINTNIAPVSYYDYEVERNEEKRSIVIIKPEFVPRIEAQLKTLMSK
jgi:hypothetical protein